jgi:phospholipase/carboxylesterase
MIRRLLPILILVPLAVGLISCPSRDPRLEPDAPASYVVRLPPDYDSTLIYPLVIALHAHGQDETQPIKFWDDGYFYDPDFILLSIRAPFQARSGYSWVSEAAGAPSDPVQLRRASALAGEERILDILDEVLDQYAADEDEVYLLGYYQGALPAFYTALRHPDLFGGVAAEGGILDTLVNPPRTLKGAQYLDIYLSVGRDEGPSVVQGVSRVRDMLARAGATVRLNVHPGGNAVSYQSCRAMEDFYSISASEAPEGSAAGEPAPSGLESPDEGTPPAETPDGE